MNFKIFVVSKRVSCSGVNRIFIRCGNVANETVAAKVASNPLSLISVFSFEDDVNVGATSERGCEFDFVCFVFVFHFHAFSIAQRVGQ